MTDIQSIAKKYSKEKQKYFIDILNENDKYNLSFGQHKADCIYKLFDEWHKLFPAHKQDVNCTGCRNAVIKFFKTMHIEWDTQIQTPKKKTRAKKSKK
jgi:hypothetical protein